MLATLILLVWLNILYYTLMMSCLRKLSGVLGGGVYAGIRRIPTSRFF